MVPCIGRAHHLLRMLPKVPIEAGILDQTLIVCLRGCFLQTRRNPFTLLNTEQVQIHQSRDITPMVNIINVNPFANMNQTVPGYEFTKNYLKLWRPYPSDKLPVCPMPCQHCHNEMLLQLLRQNFERTVNIHCVGHRCVEHLAPRSYRICPAA